MIRDSAALMTIFDIAIVAMSISALVASLRYRQLLQNSGQKAGSTLIVSGLLVMGSLGLIDLCSLWVLPALTSQVDAARTMKSLHINYTWWVVIVGTGSILLGLTRMIRRLLDQNMSLREKSEWLSELTSKLERQTRDLQRSESRYKALEELSPVGIWHASPGGECTCVNGRWCDIAGLNLEEALGEGWVQALHPGDRERVLEQWKSDVENGRTFRASYRLQGADDSARWVSAQALPSLDAQGALTGYVGTITDVTEAMEVEEQLKKSLDERDHLLREIHHRVKNNLQIVSSLLDLQADSIEDPQVLSLFEDSRDRVDSVALIHEKLYASRDFNRTDFKAYIESLLANLAYSFSNEDRAITFDIAVGDVSLNIETAVPCALVITELVANAVKHGFPEDRQAQNEDKHVCISFQSPADGAYELAVSDNGVGIPPWVDFNASKSLGLQLIRTLSKQLDGELRLVPGDGTTVELNFKDHEYAGHI